LWNGAKIDKEVYRREILRAPYYLGRGLTSVKGIGFFNKTLLLLTELEILKRGAGPICQISSPLKNGPNITQT
jgi:hypothetical protein